MSSPRTLASLVVGDTFVDRLTGTVCVVDSLRRRPMSAEQLVFKTCFRIEGTVVHYHDVISVRQWLRADNSLDNLVLTRHAPACSPPLGPHLGRDL